MLETHTSAKNFINVQQFNLKKFSKTNKIQKTKFHTFEV
jgi:hypothetical protein